jgi:hypothetical protein
MLRFFRRPGWVGASHRITAAARARSAEAQHLGVHHPMISLNLPPGGWRPKA